MRPCFNQSRPSHNVSRPYLNRGHRPDGNVCPSPNLGQGRQCSPSQFGLSPNEQFQDAQMFRNLDFETDRAALEELQRQGPRRPAYQPRAPRLSGLPDECLENMSFPSTGHSGGSPQMGNECLDDVSSPSILRDLSSGVISCIDDSALRNEAFIANESMPDWCNTDVSEPSAGMECIGNAPDPQCQQSTELTNVLDRFAALKRRMAADGSGPPPCPQDDCIAGAEKSTTTEIDTNAGCIVKEVVLQQSRIENGELQKTTKHIITRRDACGNETSECNESKETCAAPPREPAKARPPISPDQGVQYCGRDPYLESLACNVRRRLDFDVSDEIMNEPCPTCDEQLGDESAPIFAASLSCSPQNIGYESATQGYLVDYSAPSLEMESPISPQTRSQRMPSFQIFCDESAPADECSDNVRERSLPNRNMSMRRSPIQRSLPSAQICDMGSPSFGSSLPSSATPECLGDISAPDLAMGTPISPLSRFERMPSFEMGSQHLSAVSAPSFARSMPSPAAECSDNVRERSLPNRSKSMRSSPRPTPMPSPAQGPCPQRSMSMRGSPRVPSQQISMHSSQRSRSMPSEQICAIQEPSPCPSPSPSPSPSPCPVPSPCPPSFHESFLPSPQPEFLDEVSAPSLGRSMSMRRSPIQRSLPSAQICDMGSPSFGSSLPSSATPECLGDISAPDLAMGTPISPLSRFERMPSFEMGSQHLSAVSAPSFARSMPSPAAECSDNVRERSLPNRSMSMRRSPRPTPMPSPAQGPCPQSSIPMRGSPIQRSLPSEQISDIQEPSLYKSPPPPSFHASWLPSPQSEAMFEFTPAPFQTMPSGMTSTQDSMASDQIWDMTSPSFGSSLPSSATPEFLADISAPPLAMGTPISPLTRFQRMPSFDLSAISAPSFGTPGGSGMSSSVRDCSNVAQPPSLGRSLPSTVARSLPSQFSSAIGSGLDSEEYELYANVSLPSTFNSSHIGRPTTVGRSIPSWLSSASELSSVTRSLPSQFTPASGPGMNSEEYQKYANVSIPSTLDISNFGRRPTPVERPDRPMPSWLTTGSAPSTVPRSLPSQFSSAIGPGLNSEEYQRYANVSLPSTFDRPFRGRPCSPEAEPEPMPNEEAMYDDEQPPLPENSYRETIAITSSVHSIATRLVQDNRNISDISQPTFETVSSNQSSRSPINQNSPGGFETMANYMPFEEQFQRSPSSQRAPNRNNTNPFDDTGSSINDRCCPQVNVTFSGLPSFNATSSRNRNHTM